MTSSSTMFGDFDKNGVRDEIEKAKVGYWLYLYIIILLSHILLSIALIPMVLISFVRAIQKQFVYHKKIAKITFPIWLYVTTTGVIVYIMISPYY
jgi:putative membrane protein